MGCYLRSSKELEDLDCGSPHDVEYAGSIAVAGPAHLPTDSAALTDIGRACTDVADRFLGVTHMPKKLITVDADNRISKVAYGRTDQGVKQGGAVTSTASFIVELSGYGQPVRVEGPTGVR